MYVDMWVCVCVCLHICKKKIGRKEKKGLVVVYLIISNRSPLKLAKVKKGDLF